MEQVGMLQRNSSYGSIVAIVTPFASNGRIDRKALESLVEWHIAEKTDGIACSGSTGEGFALSRAERKTVAEICLKTAAARIPIIVATGTCSTKETILFTEDALQLGSSGCLIVTPYYNKPSQKGCLEHFREISKVGLPIIVYHNPLRTAFRFARDALRELAEIPGIVAFKDSGRDFELIQDLYSKLAVLAGDDDLTGDLIELGGKGVISVIGNVIPRGWSQAVHLALAKDPKSKELFERYMPLCCGNFLETNPQCVKYLVSQMGRCKPILRLPLQLPTPETQKTLRKILWKMALRGCRQPLRIQPVKVGF
jgi:4-hydroxy-tetrahydrodipicolinate synthase